MKSRFSVKRIAGVALAVGSLFVLVGDRGMTATPQGIDPLEVLNLQIKPNVLIILDSSGSMNLSPGATQDVGADHPASRMGSAKRVLRQALLANESKVNMMFGQYTQTNITSGATTNFSRRTVATQAATGGGLYNQDRFSYWSDRIAFPSMSTTELSANLTYAFQIIQNTTHTRNFQVYFTEDVPLTATDAVCTASITPAFYRTGALLATEMTTRMNGATCTGGARANSYTVTYNTGVFTFTRNAGGTRNFTMNWSNGTDSVRGVLNRAGTATPAFAAGPFTSGDSRIPIFRRLTGDKFTETAAAVTNTFYEALTGRWFNGETFYVLSNGTVCDMSVGTPAVPPALPYVNLQLVTGATCPASAAAAASGTPVRFDSAGGPRGGWSGNGNSCGGFNLKTQLRACDNTAGQALAINTPFLEFQWQVDTTPGANLGRPVTTQGQETIEGVGRWSSAANILPYGIPADGFTPLGNSLSDIKQVFTRYYNGAAITDASIGTVTIPPSGQINQHLQPRERTIVLFVTDGDDTCGTDGNPATARNAREAAYQAQLLYTPIGGGIQYPSGQLTAASDPAASVTTYIVGYGTDTTPAFMNMIAWGGSGMRTSAEGAWGSTFPTAADRILCQTCQDAFIAPDPASLAQTLQSIFDQGAQSGEFTAQQSITDSIYEYVDQAGDPDGPGSQPAFSPTLSNRYGGVTPVRFISSFTLPGFNGQVKAFINNSAGNSVMLWSAGDKLTNAIGTRMSDTVSCPIAGNTNQANSDCLFTQLHGNATDATIGTSNAAIRRRIYTTSQNGYFSVTVANLMARQAPSRISLWPPQNTTPAVAPIGLGEGLFDEALGLPLDSAASPATEFTNLQNKFRVCLSGPNIVLPPSTTPTTNCESTTDLTKMQQARREAREIILAFMAGAQPVIDSDANPKRVRGTGANAGQILYKAKPWALAESSLATAAVVGPPISSTPDGTPYVPEYEKFQIGPGSMDEGFGLRVPATGTAPVMTVVYAGANDMLHAFRAGSAFPLGATRSGGTCGSEITVGVQQQMSTALTAAPADCGGDELWGFVPFDQLSKLYSRVINNPQRRDPHDYMVARGVRFSDVFVPGTGPGVTTGVWRKVIFFGRGIGGKHLTAIDVTAPGEFTRAALATTGPIPLWSRGNPDTTNGKVGGPTVNNAGDLAAYAKMGQTWSIPAVGYVDKAANITTRKPGGTDFALYMGSGYGATGEGTTLFTMDALTGDMVAAADVEPVATANGLNRTGRAYPNAIVANPIVFNPSRYDRPGAGVAAQPHPAAALATRVYVGDLYGRFWKLLTASPSTVIPMADLEDPSGSGPPQPVGTAASLIGLPAIGTPKIPYIYVTTGNENRENGPFKSFGFRDDGTDISTAVSPPVVANFVRAFPPVVSTFTREFDQGPVVNNAAPTPYPVFRGSTQPATAYTDTDTGVAFFVGTRFNPPLSAFAPLPVSGQAATYPCRSTFDSIIYALSATSGAAAYDLNASGDDAYTIFRDSRVVGITTQAGQGQTYVVADQGLVKPNQPANPPPPPGVPPQITTATSSVRMLYRAGAPMPAIRFGSSVCQM